MTKEEQPSEKTKPNLRLIKSTRSAGYRDFNKRREEQIEEEEMGAIRRIDGEGDLSDLYGENTRRK